MVFHIHLPNGRLLILQVVPVPVRKDNYAYLLVDDTTQQAAAIDPYDVPKIQAAIKELGQPINIVAAITTHHHQDHSGGNTVHSVRFQLYHSELIKRYRNSYVLRYVARLALICGLARDLSGRCNIWRKREGPSLYEDCQGQGHLLNWPYSGQVRRFLLIYLFLSTSIIRCLATPCHTRDSICYYVTDSADESQRGGVFTGDTLFIGGNGRFFEGTGGIDSEVTTTTLILYRQW